MTKSFFPRVLGGLIKLFQIFMIPLMLLGCGKTATKNEQKEGNLKYVDPTIGNVGHLLEPTRPTVQQPNQMMRMHPMRKSYLDDQISSFPLIIVSHRLGQAFSIIPRVNKPDEASWNNKATYDHDLEITRPWYYATDLIDDNIRVEYTAGKKTGIYRFHFPDGSVPYLQFGLYNNGEASYHFISSDEIAGEETYHDNIKVFLYGKFSSPWKNYGTVKDGKWLKNGEVKGKNIKSWVSFQPSKEVMFKYAISYLSPDQAQKNFEEEIAHTTFDNLKDAGEKAWSKVINQIHTEGGTIAQRRAFYTALYRCYERMVDITEDGRYFSGFDHQIHQTNRPFYVDDWSWDTYLAHHPLRTILQPSQEEDMLQSYVTMYKQSGWLPTFPVLFGDHACMNGFHSSISILDAYRKGLRNIDIQAAYDGMRKNSTQATLLPWRNGPGGNLEKFYDKNGYFPALEPGEKETDSMVHPFEKRQAVAVTLGASYDDWAVGQMAKELDKKEDFQFFERRSKFYKNLWNDKVNMFMPKNSKGNWINIDPKFDGGMGARDYYDENNGWTYLWQVQHDIPGLINLMGGKQKFETKLDQLFREDLGRSKYAFWARLPDATGLVGEYSMGNEPSFHIPYLYNFTGSPWKTQKRIRFLLDVWFRDNIFSIPGDEDGGGMSAFVVFSSMGFYPVVPGSPYYTIGSPVFKKVTIDLKNGKKFTMIANHCSVRNKYIQKAKFNGKVLDTPWFSHQQLINGGVLELEMGDYPNKKWGLGSFNN